MKTPTIILLILFTALLQSTPATRVFAADKPNIILIMVDDMGFSDIGCDGAEIDTPNLDQLAANGLRYRNFYNTGRCCPTRASLLTGLYSHQTGIGVKNNPVTAASSPTTPSPSPKHSNPRATPP